MRDELTALFEQRMERYLNNESVTVNPGSYTLRSISGLLSNLGNPHHDLQIIHIAGTNGKGSTAWMCEALAREHDLTTGLYSSPHLDSVFERIRINGLPIEPDKALNLLDQAEKALSPELHPTWFDMMTVIAFLAFKEAGCDISIIETGLGGRLDSTNTAVPKVCILTAISLDHRYILGDTPAAIATEKAGIIKRGVPVVSAAQTAEVATVISCAAQAAGAPLIRFGHECTMRAEDNGSLTWHCAGHDLAGINLTARGIFQRENFSLALCAFSLLYPPDEAAVRRAALVEIPGRLQTLCSRPLLLFDPGHNAAALTAVARTLHETSQIPELVFLTLMADKEPEVLVPLLRKLFPQEHSKLIYVIDHSPRAWKPVAENQPLLDGLIEPEPESIIHLIKTTKAECILACGSFRTHGLWIKTATLLQSSF